MCAVGDDIVQDPQNQFCVERGTPRKVHHGQLSQQEDLDFWRWRFGDRKSAGHKTEHAQLPEEWDGVGWWYGKNFKTCRRHQESM